MKHILWGAVVLAALASCDSKAPAPIAAPKPGTIIKDCDTCPEVVVIPPGSFTQGFDGGEPERYEGKPHQVKIAYSFAVGKTEVTTGQFREFVEATGHQTSDVCNIWDGKTALATPGTGWRNPGYGRPAADNEPVACVTWVDGKAYADWLSKKTGKKYRLLTESEWEYAARAGATTYYTWGDDPNGGCEIANIGDQSVKDLPPPFTPRPFTPATCNDGYSFIAPAGALKANAFGVHDMIGSVWEWVEDCYVFPYPDNTPTDGSAYTGPNGCDRRVSKGGSWGSAPERQRPTFRGRDPETLVSQVFGFRIARDL
ncbi:MAG: formylglycine-generating enzyme family protein [Rhodospirillaceae bacterium]|nr:formylglycine-generating enzyme family protein [Rhodospirillaceae bacterium]